MTEQYDKRTKPSALSPETIIEIQKEAITFGNTNDFGLREVVRDYGTLEFICDRCNTENDLIERAAMGLFYIANYHPFFDANKRTALLTATTILEQYYLFITPTTGLTDIEIEHIASPEGTLKESREWIRKNIIWR